MKKYKLLQEYPLLPNTMKVGFEVEWNNPLNAYHHALTLDVFNKSEVEKYPKFWKAIEISDFQITSLRGVKEFCLEGKVYTIGSDGTFRSDGHLINLSGISLHSMLHEGNSVDSGVLEILSVRRTVDYIEFTLGDKITPEPFVRGRKFTVVDKIYFNEHNQLSYSTKDGAAPKTFVFGQNTTHYKSPFFTSEDGVDMYEGDTIHVIQVDYTGKVTTQILSYKITSNARVGDSKIFSTKDAAWEYILFHMKTLSVKDVFEAWKESKSTYPISISFLENIKNLVDKRVKRCNDKLI